jgi:hypothetical protein
MEFVRKHIDAMAGAASMGWGALVVLVPGAAPLAEYVSAEAAFAFGLLAFGRWYAGIKA